MLTIKRLFAAVIAAVAVVTLVSCQMQEERIDSDDTGCG